MILSDRTIKEYIDKYKLADNVTKDNIQPASLDITIGDTFSFPTEALSSGIIKMDEEIQYTTLTQDTYILMPQQFVLATTEQYFRIPNNLTAFVEGRSSIGRLGLFIQNAGWVDPGFEGQITLELFNASRYAIEIKAGTRVGQLVFAKMDLDAENPYKGKYQGQTGATGSRIYKDFNDIEFSECTDELNKMQVCCRNCKYGSFGGHFCGYENMIALPEQCCKNFDSEYKTTVNDLKDESECDTHEDIIEETCKNCNYCSGGIWCKKLLIPTNFRNGWCSRFESRER